MTNGPQNPGILRPTSLDGLEGTFDGNCCMSGENLIGKEKVVALLQNLFGHQAIGFPVECCILILDTDPNPISISNSELFRE